MTSCWRIFGLPQYHDIFIITGQRFVGGQHARVVGFGLIVVHKTVLLFAAPGIPGAEMSATQASSTTTGTRSGSGKWYRRSVASFNTPCARRPTGGFRTLLSPFSTRLPLAADLSKSRLPLRKEFMFFESSVPNSLRPRAGCTRWRRSEANPPSSVAAADIEIHHISRRRRRYSAASFRRADVRFADDFNQRHAGAVQIQP